MSAMDEAFDSVRSWCRHMHDTTVLIGTASGSVYVAQINPGLGQYTVQQLVGNTFERLTGEWYSLWNLVEAYSEVRTRSVHFKLHNPFSGNVHAINTATVKKTQHLPALVSRQGF